jgi:isoleucyl-tRNA synthetase
MSASEQPARDYRATIFLPKTDFPMRAGLPKREPEILARWQEMGLYDRLREQSRGLEKYVLHDGPPYANGHLHIGHALNKILKDVITRSFQMTGYDSIYVPGWDCHGLPIEWKIEEQYRAQGKNKDDVEIIEFRAECREFAEHWVDVQREEFKRLGIEGDWDKPYSTMTYAAEAQIAREVMKFAANGGLYRGSKPVMWSVVERTALAEAEVEYHEHTSPTIWAKFPVVAEKGDSEVADASIVIWTTTPWTIPGNRAISFSRRIEYGLYEVTGAPDDNWAKPGDKLILADSLVEEVMQAARVEAFKRHGAVEASILKAMTCHHPLRGLEGGYQFDVPLFDGDHVTEEAGTGFVHTAPGHGREDFDIWTDNESTLKTRRIDATIPFTVDGDGLFTSAAPGFEGKRVVNDKGKFGDANDAVIAALAEAGALIARGRLRHEYPHSWRSKAPVIFRNTPQWFISMAANDLRKTALEEIAKRRFVPATGRNRLHSMIETKPDWVISRQRAWGVPITVFVNKETQDVLVDERVNKRIADAFEAEGADAWFKDGARERLLEGLVDDPADWEKVDDILDVWFESGSTHAFVLEAENNSGNWDLKWPASLYLEGTDQHRGWFHSSLLVSCGTRGRAPFDAVLTHGFVMDEDGRKMSKSLGNVVTPQDVIKQNGADILRLWVMSSDYAEDLRIGPEIIKSNVDAYRKLRNTMRFLLGSLAGFGEGERADAGDMPELERYILHRLWQLDDIVRQGYQAFDFKRIFAHLFNFATLDLSAFYFDIRKDALYCDKPSETRRRACRSVLDEIYMCLTAWLAPMLSYTMEEVWLSRFPDSDISVHMRQFPDVPAQWRDDQLAAKWDKVRTLRRVVTGALEIERQEKRIGSSLEANPCVYVEDKAYLVAYDGLDPAEIFITSQAALKAGAAPGGAFVLEDLPGIAVVPGRAVGSKCARSWKILPEVGSDPDYPDLSLRDADAVRDFDRRTGAAA